MPANATTTDRARFIDRFALACAGSPDTIRHIDEGAARRAVLSPASSTPEHRPMTFLRAVLFLAIGAFLL